MMLFLLLEPWSTSKMTTLLGEFRAQGQPEWWLCLGDTAAEWQKQRKTHRPTVELIESAEIHTRASKATD